MSARTNDELLKALGITERAWADCAAVVDAVVDCMNRVLGSANE